MKKGNIFYLFIVLISLVSTTTLAHDIQVKNADGVEICYIWINNHTELAVSYCGHERRYDRKYAGNVVIPGSVTYKGVNYNVTSIGNNAFYGSYDLTSVTIPNSVTSIGNYAFGNCSGLTSITIPNSVTSIGKEAFLGCSGLTSITIPNSVTSIGEFAFIDCSELTSVNISDLEAWCKISFDEFPFTHAYHLYLNGKEIKDLVIPASVTSVGSYAFCDCAGLTSVTIPNSVTSIGDGVFYQCSGLTSVTIPSSVASIGNKEFFGCAALTSVTIPNSVMSIGYGAFMECIGLTSITIPNSVTTIEDRAFEHCEGLISVTIPNSVMIIGASAFEGCVNLPSITLPNSITSIDLDAFRYCYSLTSITIPNSVKSIGNRAFEYCISLTDVYCYSTVAPGTGTDVFKKSNIENATLHVPAKAVETYRISWPWSNFNNIVAIGSTPADDLKDYIYEAGINNNWGTPEQPLYSANRDGIYRGFFYAQEADWSGGKGAFKFTGAFNSWEEGNYGLGHINADGLSGTLIDDENSGNILATPGFYRADVNLVNMTYELTPISSIGIIGPAQPGGWSTDTDLTYNPKTLAWEGTMKLAAEEFKFRANDSWDINWGGIAINNLKQDGPNLSIDEAGTYFIQFFPLCETKSYATMTLVSDPTPGDDPTSGSCGETVDYSYDKATQTLTIFGKGAIYDYDNGSNKAPWSSYADEIQKIEIESGITSIGYFAFYKCSGITSLSIPATVGYIGSSSFEDCTSLTSLSLSEGLLYFGGSAFEGCSGLQTLTIPSTVNTISINAFKNCKGITDVYCLAVNVPDTHYKVFDGTPTEKSTLHVPAKAVEAYRASWPWSDFKDIVALTNEDLVGIQSVKQSEDRNDLYYDLTGRKVSHPLKGIYIKNGKKVVGK